MVSIDTICGAAAGLTPATIRKVPQAMTTRLATRVEEDRQRKGGSKQISVPGQTHFQTKRIRKRADLSTKRRCQLS